MNPAEYIELILTARDAVGGHVANFTTVLFAYLIMSYLVAAKLTKIQIWSATLIYTIYQFLPVNAAIQDLHTAGGLMAQFRERFPEEAAIHMPSAQTFPEVFAITAFAGWALSILFMTQQRAKGGT